MDGVWVQQLKRIQGPEAREREGHMRCACASAPHHRCWPRAGPAGQQDGRSPWAWSGHGRDHWVCTLATGGTMRSKPATRETPPCTCLCVARGDQGMVWTVAGQAECPTLAAGGIYSHLYTRAGFFPVSGFHPSWPDWNRTCVCAHREHALSIPPVGSGDLELWQHRLRWANGVGSSPQSVLLENKEKQHKSVVILPRSKWQHCPLEIWSVHNIPVLYSERQGLKQYSARYWSPRGGLNSTYWIRKKTVSKFSLYYFQPDEICTRLGKRAIYSLWGFFVCLQRGLYGFGFLLKQYNFWMFPTSQSCKDIVYQCSKRKPFSSGELGRLASQTSSPSKIMEKEKKKEDSTDPKLGQRNKELLIIKITL